MNYKWSSEEKQSQMVSPQKQPKPTGYGTHINYTKCHGLSVSLCLSLFSFSSLLLPPCCTFFIPTDIPQTSDGYRTTSSRRHIPLSCCHSAHPQTHLPSNQWPCSTAAQQPSTNKTHTAKPSVNNQTNRWTDENQRSEVIYMSDDT